MMPHAMLYTSRTRLFSMLAVVLCGALGKGHCAAPTGGKTDSRLRPELVLQVGHSDNVAAVAFSRDGKTLASGSGDKSIKLWDVATGKLTRTLTGHRYFVKAVAFLPDDKTLASADARNIHLWDTSTGKLTRILGGDSDWVHCVAVSPNGKTLASDGDDKSITLWDVATGKPIRTLSGHSAMVNRVAYSPDGKALASVSDDKSIKLWDVSTGRLTRTLTGHSDVVFAVVFSRDGETLATGSWDKSIKLWNVASGKLTRTLTGHSGVVSSVVFSPEGRWLASSSWDKTIKLWDARSGKLTSTLTGHSKSATSVTFSPDGKSLASGSGDKSIKLWNVANGKLTRTFSGHSSEIQSVAFSADGQLASGNEDYSIKLWDATSGKLTRTQSGYNDGATDYVNGVYSLAFSSDGKALASSGMEKSIRLWDARSGKLTHTLTEHTSNVPYVAFSSDGQRLASGSWDKTVKLWDVATGNLTGSLSGHSDVVSSVVFSPDGRTLASSSRDKTIKLWDVASGNLTGTLSGHSQGVHEVDFSPDGRTLASAGGSDIKLWDVATGKLIRTLDVSGDGVGLVTFSPDGKTLASNGWHNIKLWDVASGKLTRTLSGHSHFVRGVAYSPDGQRLVSVSGDTTVKLWNANTGQLLATLLTLPEVAAQTSDNAKALSLGAKALSLGAKSIEAAQDEWFITTPEGWFDCSANAARFITWRVNNQLVPAERYYRVLRRPNLVQKALRGETVPEPDLSNLDIPPQAQFTRVQYNGDRTGDKGGETVTATLEVRGRRNFREVTVLVNGRPLPPENEVPIEVSSVPADLEARPLSLGAKPLSLGVRAFDIGANPLSLGAKPVGSVSTKKDTRYTAAKRYTFKVPLPIGATEIKLRAFAYDEKELGSNPTEIILSRPDAKRVLGNLYILCAGIGTYKNGSDAKVSDATGFSNLKFPDEDAQAVVERLKSESAPLYEKVEVFNGGPLLNGQATLANLRAGLKWLQSKARPGQIDTAVIFLSGHGLSDPQGRYYFPAYEFNKADWQNTSLSGRELQAELGGKLRARSVFLFVDTCHSGALVGARSDDLNFEVNSSGVYMLASSGSTQYSYESDKWGHGAFTLALLRSLARKELAPDGTIRFNVLTYAVPDEIAKLMKEAGQNEGAMAPVVPLEGRRLDEPVAQVK